MRGKRAVPAFATRRAGQRTRSRNAAGSSSPSSTCAILSTDTPPQRRDGGTGRRSGLKIRRDNLSWGFDPPSRHQQNKGLSSKKATISRVAVFAWWLFWWLLGFPVAVAVIPVAVLGGCSCGRDSVNYRQFVVCRQVSVPGRHGNGFVTSQLLNLFDRCPSHCQPRAESVPI